MKISFRALTCFAFVAILCVAGHRSLAADGAISVEVPASKPSRPANFDWKFTSGNGAAPQIGQFACGSYWVAPAEGDAGVILVSLTSPAGQELLTCDADPITEKMGLLSGKNHYGNYDAAENVLPNLPLTLKPADDSCVSLVAAMQRDEAAESKGGTAAIVGEVADAYCVVTVMPKAPKDGGKNMIRPNITGAHKEFLTWDDFDLTRLSKIDFIKGRTAEGWAGARIRWSHSTEIFGMSAEVQTAKRGIQLAKFSEGGRAFRAALLVSNYASGTAREFNGDLLATFSAENNLEDMKPALAAMIGYGLDIYHARYDYGTNARKAWSSGAGQSLGQFLPPVFAAALLRDETKANQLRNVAVTNHGADSGELGPQELRQLTRGTTGVLLWGDGTPIKRTDGAKGSMLEQDWRYWGEFVADKCYDGYEGKGNPNQGQKTAADPYGYIDGPAGMPGTNYMSVSLGGFRSFAAAEILMPAIRSVVNSDDPIEYVDRITRHGLWTSPDPVAVPAKVDRETAKLWWGATGVAEWQKTWGVRPDDVRFAIEDGVGRFKSLNGRKFKGGYESNEALSNWDKIIALYNGPKFEDNAVPLGTVVAPEIIIVPGDKPQAYITCPTIDAKIHYTVDGTVPTAESPVYDGKPIDIDAKAKVQAFAELEGKKPSAIRSKSVPPALK